MAPLPAERLKPAPVWYNTALDIFGPFAIKGKVNRRTLGKGYGVIFTCLLPRAIFIDVACDYSTDAFLLVLRRFVKRIPCKHVLRFWVTISGWCKGITRNVQFIRLGENQEHRRTVWFRMEIRFPGSPMVQWLL